MVHMEVWANETFTDKTHCQVTVDDHRLIRGNRIMLVLINTSDDIVTLPASSCVAFAKVKEANENSLRSQPLVPNRTLLFLKHYNETCAMTNIEETLDGGLSFGNGHEIKLRKNAKVNFKITYSEVLKPPNGELYSVDSVVFFLQHFKGDYKEYLQLAMSKRVPIIAHR